MTYPEKALKVKKQEKLYGQQVTTYSYTLKGTKLKGDASDLTFTVIGYKYETEEKEQRYNVLSPGHRNVFATQVDWNTASAFMHAYALGHMGL